MDLTRDKISKANDLKPIKIDVPAWGGSVYVRALSATERLEFEEIAQKLALDDSKATKTMALYLCHVLSDSKGVRLFSDADVDIINGKNASIVLDLFNRASDHNSLTHEDIKDLEKNL